MKLPFDVEWLGFEPGGAALRARFKVAINESRYGVVLRVSRRGAVEDLQVPELGLVGTTGDVSLDARLQDQVERRLIAARDAAIVQRFDRKADRR